MSTIKHNFVSLKPDSAIVGLIQPSHWNDEHSFSPPINGIPIDDGTGNFTGIAATQEGQFFRRQYNTSNPAYEFTSNYFLRSTDYQFSTTSTQSLAAGVSTAIVLHQLPNGVRSAYSPNNHYVRIVDGVAGNEVCLISAVNDGAKTITITPAIAHSSGNYTITSATAGIQEAVNVLPVGVFGGGRITTPTGVNEVFATVKVTTSYVRISGNSRGGTAIYGSGAFPIFACSNLDQFYLHDIQLEAAAPAAVFAITLFNDSNTCLKDLTIQKFGRGVSLTGNSQNLRGMRLFFTNIVDDAVYINSPINGGSWYDCYLSNQGGSATAIGFHISQCGGLNITNCYTHQLAFGARIDPAAGTVVGVVQFLNFECDGYSANATVGIDFFPQGGKIFDVVFYGGISGGFHQNGMRFSGTGKISDILVDGMYIMGNGATGVLCKDPASTATVKNITFNDCLVESNGADATGTLPGITLLNCSNVRVNGGLCATSSYSEGSGVENSQSYGIVVAGGTSNVRIKDVVATPNVTGSIFFNGVNPGLIIEDVIGFNPIGQVVVAVGTSPFTYTAGPYHETVYIRGGTVSDIKIGVTTVAVSSPTQLTLYPNQAITVTYSVIPTMVSDRK